LNSLKKRVRRACPAPARSALYTRWITGRTDKSGAALVGRISVSVIRRRTDDWRITLTLIRPTAAPRLTPASG
jgi:hypothetical protein